MKQLQNICILEKSDFNKKYLSDHYITLVLIGRDGGLSSVYHSCKFVALLIIYIYIYIYIYACRHKAIVVMRRMGGWAHWIVFIIYIYIYIYKKTIQCTHPTHHHNGFVATCQLWMASGSVNALLVLEPMECSTSTRLGA